MAAQIERETGAPGVSCVGQSRTENRDVALSPRQLRSRRTTEPDRLRGGWHLDRHATKNPGNARQRPGGHPSQDVFAWESRGLADQNPATRQTEASEVLMSAPGRLE